MRVHTKYKITQEKFNRGHILTYLSGKLLKYQDLDPLSNFSRRRKEESKVSLIPDFIFQETEGTNNSSTAKSSSRNHHYLISHNKSLE